MADSSSWLAREFARRQPGRRASDTWPEPERSKLARLWLVAADGSSERPLTGEGTNAAHGAWSPDGTRLVYAATDRGQKDAKPQLRLLSFAGGEPETLPEFPLGVDDIAWLPDSSGLIVVSKLIVGHLALDDTAAELERRAADPVNVHATESRVVRF